MVEAFVVYNTYRVEGSQAYVYLYGRQEDGKTFLTKNKCKPYFYIKKSDEKAAKGLAASITFEKTNKVDFDQKKLVKGVLSNPKDVPDLRDSLHKADIKTYEADIRFTYRFMIDNSIQGSCDIQGKPQQHSHVDCFYDEPTFQSTDYVPENLTTLAIDIETGKMGKQLYCISLVSSTGESEVLMVSDQPVEGTTVYTTEKECLEAFTAAVRKYDPDIITGWSVIDYDLSVLKNLCEANHVPFILGRSDDRLRIKTESQFLRESSADIVGRMVLDGIVLLKTSFVRLTDYKLNTAASEILGEKKLISGKNKLQEIEDAYRNDKAKLGAYCKRDSELVLEILAKKKLIALTIKRSTLTGMQLDRVKGSIASLDNVYLRELAKRGIVANTHTFIEKPEAITGGYVMDSTPGIYDYVIVCDFKSLYPSIMRTLNIDPLSYVQKKHLKKSTAEFIVAANGAVFRNEEGILPQILERLHAARDQAKKEKDTVAIGAIKVLMNSFFGVLASPQCRFFSMAVANAITS